MPTQVPPEQAARIVPDIPGVFPPPVAADVPRAMEAARDHQWRLPQYAGRLYTFTSIEYAIVWVEEKNPSGF